MFRDFLGTNVRHLTRYICDNIHLFLHAKIIQIYLVLIQCILVMYAMLHHGMSHKSLFYFLGKHTHIHYFFTIPYSGQHNSMPDNYHAQCTMGRFGVITALLYSDRLHMPWYKVRYYTDLPMYSPESKQPHIVQVKHHKCHCFSSASKD